MALTILYRGPLSSCNYACSYCPFALRRESRAELARDRSALARFATWIEQRVEETAVFFTPWGEALIRSWYRDTIVRLSHAPRVRRVAVQTNLHASLDFLREANPVVVALWCTFHPGQTTLARFIERCRFLHSIGIRYSVGVVGRREHIEVIETLRRALPASVYVWINAYKREPEHYRLDDVERLVAVDPLFELNLRRHRSRGSRCHTGERVVSVDGAGEVRRCHFVDERLGNIYDDTFRPSPDPEPCPNATCGCHIGYAHLVPLGLDAIYAEGLLERIPTGAPTRDDARRRLSLI